MDRIINRKGIYMITFNDYLEDIKAIAGLPIPWDRLDGRSVLITGATGLIGSCMVDVLCYRNLMGQTPCHVYAMSRSEVKLRARFSDFIDKAWFIPVVQDIRQPLCLDQPIDYVINGASNAHPRAYAKDPVGTITANVMGLDSLLRYAVSHGVTRLLELSTVEVYGSSRRAEDVFFENYCGDIDCNTLRAGYPESKRVCEALCQAYTEQFGISTIIARPCRVYGPTMDMSDSKATAQFIKNILRGENITLKSKGNQLFSYAYMADVVSGLLYILLEGKSGEAYNIADSNSIITLGEMAEVLARQNNRRVVYDIPDSAEQKGFSGSMRAILDASKLEGLGWKACTSIQNGLKKTVTILSNRDGLEKGY